MSELLSLVLKCVGCVCPQHENDAQGERTKLLAQLLFDTALLESGFGLNDNKAFNKRVYSLVKDVLKIKKDFEDSAEAEVACLFYTPFPCRASSMCMCTLVSKASKHSISIRCPYLLCDIAGVVTLDMRVQSAAAFGRGKKKKPPPQLHLSRDFTFVRT